MGTEMLERRFAAIGARLTVVGEPGGAPRIDVRSDRRGECKSKFLCGGAHDEVSDGSGGVSHAQLLGGFRH
jgi:hypothetical protein